MRLCPRWLLSCVLALCLLVLFPGIVEAHAILLRSDPVIPPAEWVTKRTAMLL
jgi:hypothetical protein